MRSICLSVARMLVAGALAALTVAVRADPIQWAGGYESVVTRDGGEHCHGYSIALWRHRGGLFGLLDVHGGLCGDPPCGVIRDVRHDTTSGALEFQATVGEQRLRFRGSMSRKALVGRLGADRINLAHTPTNNSAHLSQDRTLDGWCQFWQTVPRCSGVREFCKSRSMEKLPVGR